MSVNQKRKLYIDGNTVYGIDEECIKKKEQKRIKNADIRKEENYLAVIMNFFYFQSED